MTIKKLLLFLFVAVVVSACSKNDGFIDPIPFGKIEIVNKTIFGPDSIFALINNKDILPGYALMGSSNINSVLNA
ncbi:hypothetical protein [Sphingobacterium hotanense]|uniref:hypothetical protein n=1 Tax=Sphingobacterium hotanense TaxID=649196 RepID=UPI0021A82875|nr:hypothetical protein [Sphingobacterium hotanense]MCT1526694.1 hypothetical protein [Sphingobacterium hotanense]